MSGPSLEAVAPHERVLVCVGSGGVGKTTVAAALALRAAALRAGARWSAPSTRRERLANALGLTGAGQRRATRVPSPRCSPSAGLRPAAPLQAMMLDMKPSWDELIERQRPAGQARARSSKNRFYQSLSTALAGSQEYIAMEKLWRAAQRSATTS